MSSRYATSASESLLCPRIRQVKGELDEAATAMRQAIEIQSEIGSFSGIRVRYKNQGCPQFHSLWERTVSPGLLLAGLPP
jgi:hypothetical protein